MAARCRIDVGKAELAFAVTPIELLRGDAGDDLQRALADFFPVLDEIAGTSNLHNRHRGIGFAEETIRLAKDRVICLNPEAQRGDPTVTMP
jgi:hypothetical protein